MSKRLGQLRAAGRTSIRGGEPARITAMKLGGTMISVGLLLVAWIQIAGASNRVSPLAGAGDPVSHLESRRPRHVRLRTEALVFPAARSTHTTHSAIQAASMALLAPEEPQDPAARIQPGIAFLMSAVIPGTGQAAEGRNRAFAYLGLEALAWIAHFSWIDAGNKTEGEYEAYARRHWKFAQWDSLASESNPNCQAIPPNVSYADSKETLQGYEETGNYQHYYEDIGKLEAYRSGWDDFLCEQPDVISPNRADYRGMREESNDYLDKARNALTVIFLNHVVSAVDAYRTAKGARMKLPGGTDLKVNIGGSLEHPKFGLRVSRKW